MEDADVLEIIAAFFLVDPTKEFTEHIDATVEEDEEFLEHMGNA